MLIVTRIYNFLPVKIARLISMLHTVNASADMSVNVKKSKGKLNRKAFFTAIKESTVL